MNDIVAFHKIESRIYFQYGIKNAYVGQGNDHVYPEHGMSSIWRMAEKKQNQTLVLPGDVWLSQNARSSSSRRDGLRMAFICHASGRRE